MKYTEKYVEKLEAEVKKLREIIYDYENSITWMTTCLNCAKLWDKNYEQYVRIEELRKSLQNLKGEEKSGIGEWECTRIISYHALNKMIDSILEKNGGNS